MNVQDQNGAHHVVSAPDGLRLHVRRYGAGGGRRRPVVCLPGLARTTDDFDTLAAALANDQDRARFETLWGQTLPAWKGHRILQMLEAAHRGEIDVLYSLGGNLLETMPDRAYMSEALSRVKVRIHQDIVLNSSALLPGRTVLLLPAQTRYETPGGGTAMCSPSTIAAAGSPNTMPIRPTITSLPRSPTCSRS